MENLKLIEFYVQILVMCGTIGVVWWVSATAFCGSILAGVWIKRDELTKDGSTTINILGITLSLFFLSVITFGLLMTYVTNAVSGEVRNLALTYPTTPQNYFIAVNTIFTAGFIVATSSFVLVLIIWIFVWRQLRVKQLRSRSRSKSGRQSENKE